MYHERSASNPIILVGGELSSERAAKPTDELVTPSSSPASPLLIIDPRTLNRQCLVQGFTSNGIAMEVLHFASIEEWRLEGAVLPAAVLYKFEKHNITGPLLQNEITKICAAFAPAPVILLSDVEDINLVFIALDCGVRGYIPTSLDVGVCLQAISLVAKGGVFVPASSVLGMRQTLQSGSAAARPFSGMFTDRQAQVVEALRQGKANKIIAYELELRESTVKVHIRNIMKKLKATNRTEVAYKLNGR